MLYNFWPNLAIAQTFLDLQSVFIRFFPHNNKYFNANIIIVKNIWWVYVCEAQFPLEMRCYRFFIYMTRSSTSGHFWILLILSDLLTTKNTRAYAMLNLWQTFRTKFSSFLYGGLFNLLCLFGTCCLSLHRQRTDRRHCKDMVASEIYLPAHTCWPQIDTGCCGVMTTLAG
jgi:hypothetical protein